MICPDLNCKTANHEYADRCIVCGHDLGAPNVREAEDESADLDVRYRIAVNNINARGANHARTELENEVEANSRAVVNMDEWRLRNILADGKELYSSYYNRVDSGARVSACPANDRERREIDGRFFGGLAEKIRFAALTVDGRGLKSYGGYAASLKVAAVKNRASLLEENSFDFVRRCKEANENWPKGYRATWRDRVKLVVAKLASRLSPTTRAEDIPKLILHSDGNRATDEFIEVHIYDGFNRDAIEKIKAPRATTRPAAVAKKGTLRHLAESIGVAWE